VWFYLSILPANTLSFNQLKPSLLFFLALSSPYRVFHPPAAQYTVFSAAHGIFSKIDCVLGHKASLKKYKKIEITPCILSDHKGIKLELNSKK
jgi:hypothetical protein